MSKRSVPLLAAAALGVAFGAAAQPLAIHNPEAEARYLRTCEARSGGGPAAFCLASMAQLQADLGPEAFDAPAQEVSVRDCAAALDRLAVERHGSSAQRQIVEAAAEACFAPPALQLELGITGGR
jgi:hypothetical protein